MVVRQSVSRTCFRACKVLSSISRHVTLNSSAEMVLCTGVCCASNELDNSTADSSWLESVVRRSKDYSMTELGELGCPRGSSSSSRGRWQCILSPKHVPWGFWVERVRYIVSTIPPPPPPCLPTPPAACARAATPASQFTPRRSPTRPGRSYRYSSRHHSPHPQTTPGTEPLLLRFPIPDSSRLLHQLSQQPCFARNRIMRGDNALQRTGLLEVGRERGLGVVQMSLEVAERG